MIDEHSLLAKARQLDPDALAEIHHQYYDPIFRYIAFRIEDRDLVQDLASEVFIRLIDALKKRRAPQQTLQGWLYGVAAHVISEHRRSLKRGLAADLDETIPSEDSDPQEQFDADVDQSNLRAAMDELTKDQQMVIVLRFANGLSIREVSRAMGKSEGAVKQLQLRAVEALTRRLMVGVK